MHKGERITSSAEWHELVQHHWVSNGRRTHARQTALIRRLDVGLRHRTSRKFRTAAHHLWELSCRPDVRTQLLSMVQLSGIVAQLHRSDDLQGLRFVIGALGCIVKGDRTGSLVTQLADLQVMDTLNTHRTILERGQSPQLGLAVAILLQQLSLTTQGQAILDSNVQCTLSLLVALLRQAPKHGRLYVPLH